jgi:hypothetical protein
MTAKAPKITQAAFAYHRRWNKYILGYCGDLGDGHSKDRLLAYCFAMADKGTEGCGCYASDATIGREIRRDRDTVGRYRHLAIELGWFKVVGSRNRVEILDIQIPVAADVRQPTPPPIAADVRQPNPASCRRRSALPRDLPTADPDQGLCEHFFSDPFEPDRCEKCNQVVDQSVADPKSATSTN